MSNVSEQAVINLTIADYANVDNGGKANLVGVGGGIIPLTPTGLTARFPYSPKFVYPVACARAR